MLTFYKGPRNAYDVETHGDGIYFTTDTCEIIHDGKTYSSGSKIYSNGSDSEKTIIDIQLNGNELTIEYSDGSTQTIPLLEHTAGTNISIEDRVISALGYTWTDNLKSFSEGDTAEASGAYSHAEGYNTHAEGEGSHAEGYNAIKKGSFTLHILTNDEREEIKNETGLDFMYANNADNILNNCDFSLYSTSSYTNLLGTSTSSMYVATDSVDGDVFNLNLQDGVILEDGETYFFITKPANALGSYSHSEGANTRALGYASHTEGINTRATDHGSHAEGQSTIAKGHESHAEGQSTIAKGPESHAEGYYTRALGWCSHSEGQCTRATNQSEHAEGAFNVSNPGTRSSIGIGTSNNDRKNAFEVMKNGDIYVYGLGNYDGTNPGIENADGVKGKPLQTAISNNTNRIQVVNVTNLPYKFTDRKVDTKLLFNLNCDAKTLYENQDDFYVTLSKYSNRRKKQIVLNDMIKSDARLRVYCWVIKNGSSERYNWTYFYTLEDYDDNVDALLYYDSEIFTKRRPHCTERLSGSLGMSNNYINYIDELCSSGYVSDVSGLIERYIPGDTDKYFVGNLSKNPIAQWKGTYFDESESLTISEKYNFFLNYLSNLIFWRGIHKNYDVDTYSFHSYVGDYPIYPVKLADCQVIVYGAIADELGFNESQGQTKLANLTLNQLQRLSQITLILPFKANYIVKRLYSPQVWDFEFRDPEIINKDIFEGACKIGGNRRLVYYNWVSFKNYLKLGICNKRQLISNTFKDIPQYDFKLITFDAGPYMKYTYGDNEINTLITRVM